MNLIVFTAILLSVSALARLITRGTIGSVPSLAINPSMATGTPDAGSSLEVRRKHNQMEHETNGAPSIGPVIESLTPQYVALYRSAPVRLH